MGWTERLNQKIENMTGWWEVEQTEGQTMGQRVRAETTETEKEKLSAS